MKSLTRRQGLTNRPDNSRRICDTGRLVARPNSSRTLLGVVLGFISLVFVSGNLFAQGVPGGSSGGGVQILKPEPRYYYAIENLASGLTIRRGKTNGETTCVTGLVEVFCCLH